MRLTHVVRFIDGARTQDSRWIVVLHGGCYRQALNASSVTLSEPEPRQERCGRSGAGGVVPYRATHRTRNSQSTEPSPNDLLHSADVKLFRVYQPLLTSLAKSAAVPPRRKNSTTRASALYLHSVSSRSTCLAQFSPMASRPK
jgi:hypothetical protein